MPKRRRKKKAEEPEVSSAILLAEVSEEPQVPKPDPKLLEKIGKLETELTTANNNVAELTKQVRKLENVKIELQGKLTSKTDKLKQVLQLMSEKPSLPYPENSKILPWVAKLEATCK